VIGVGDLVRFEGQVFECEGEAYGIVIEQRHRDMFRIHWICGNGMSDVVDLEWFHQLVLDRISRSINDLS
jgi:hypothetical protein